LTLLAEMASCARQLYVRALAVLIEGGRACTAAQKPRNSVLNAPSATVHTSITADEQTLNADRAHLAAKYEDADRRGQRAVGEVESFRGSADPTPRGEDCAWTCH
jgi:hypothetical protein